MVVVGIKWSKQCLALVSAILSVSYETYFDDPAVDIWLPPEYLIDIK